MHSRAVFGLHAQQALGDFIRRKFRVRLDGLGIHLLCRGPLERDPAVPRVL